jgi:exodeoxyribonuclease VII small subunit
MPKAKSPASSSRQPATPDNEARSAAADLSYNEAHTALQLTLSALQSNDLNVEEMTGLYRRARAYLERCEAVLASVEQEVLLWDTGSGAAGPMPASPPSRQS